MRQVAFKSGVRLAGLQPEMLVAIDKCAKVLHEEFNRVLTLTSARDGEHSRHSHHYKGLAIDVRRWGIDAEQVAARFREVLGSSYQVIVEATHIHIEYDPVNAAPAPDA